MQPFIAALMAGVLVCVCAAPLLAMEAGNAKETVLHSFAGGAGGADPEAGLVAVNGMLYGTTYEGVGTGCNKNFGCGTVFAIDAKTGAERVVYSFCSQPNCADGQYPFAGLIAVKGMLYGTTNFGGAYGYGTAFALDPKTGAETVLHAFGSGTDGFSPDGGLIAVKGTLYGTTDAGGVGYCNPYGCGTVHSLDPKTGAETVLYSFCSLQDCGDGMFPTAGLIEANGTLYGTTFYGGNKGCERQGCGTVFALDPATGAETVLHTFCPHGNCADGEMPEAGLVEVDGTLYGTTVFGGANGEGTEFAVKP